MPNVHKLPTLYVEGMDDVSVINGLLKRHGIDTESGKRFLYIESLGDIDAVMKSIPGQVAAHIDRPVGFVIDIDIEVSSRWDAVRSRLREVPDAELKPPANCPAGGYIDAVPGYASQFGVWLMPDCVTDYSKMEHLIETLLPTGDPLMPFARNCVANAAALADEHTAKGSPCQRFRDVDKIKAEVHTWVAWSTNPGCNLGAAVNSRLLGCDSPQALALVDWLRRLYGIEPFTLKAE